MPEQFFTGSVSCMGLDHLGKSRFVYREGQSFGDYGYSTLKGRSSSLWITTTRLGPASGS